MRHFNILQQVPDECSQTVTIGDFQVTLIDIEPFGTGYRWIYRIDSELDNPTALSNWVLGIDEGCLQFIDACFISDLFTGDVTEEILNSFVPGNCLFDEGPIPQPAPGLCVAEPGSPTPCDLLQVAGFKFDDLPDGLALGNSRLFAFTINQPPIIKIGCAALTYGGATFCNEICLPGCVVCENPCDCDELEGEDTFTFTIPNPGPCFSFVSDLTEEDVRFGFCIGDAVDVPGEPCEGVAEVFVCGQTLLCCCEVTPWTRTVPLTIQFNIPKTADCLSDNIGEGDFLYECAVETPTVTQTCFSCNDVTSPFVAPDCSNTTITINDVTVNADGTATINYTVNLPECVDDGNGEEPPTAEPPTCPPPAPPARNIQPVNKPTINNVRSRRRYRH